MLTAKVGERRQVTIPKVLRDRYGLKQGTEVEFVDEGGRLVVRRGHAVREAVARLRGTFKLDTSVDEFIEELRGR